MPIGGSGAYGGTRLHSRGGGARGKDAELSEENLSLAKTLDEQQRVVAMQKLEIGSLKSQIATMAKRSGAALPIKKGRQDVQKILAEERKRLGSASASSAQQRHEIPGTPDYTDAPFQASGYGRGGTREP